MTLSGTRIVYMGTPEFAIAPLKALADAGADIAGVVTAPDRPAGRGRKIQPPAVKSYCTEYLDVPVLQPVKLKDPGFVQQLSALGADIFVVVAFRMLPEVVWSIPPAGTFNLHASLLPQYRGAAPINHVLINGEKETGVTTFLIDQQIDTGNILLREKVEITPGETAGSLHDRLMSLGAEVVVRTAYLLSKGKIEPRPQDHFIEAGESLKTAPKIGREDCRIDWQLEASSVCNFVRGLSPYPAAHTMLESEGNPPRQFKITGIELSDAPGSAAPGTIATDYSTYLRVTTGNGSVEITALQPSGKKTMETAAFLRGHREDLSGARFA